MKNIGLDELKEEIRKGNDLVEVIREEGVDLQNRGGERWLGRSPFNTDTNPSFYAYGDRQFWYDFSSQQGGDVFDFIMKTRNVEFMDALRHLGTRVGIEVDGARLEGESYENYMRLRKACAVLNKAAEFYHRQAMDESNRAQVQEYFYRDQYGFDTGTVHQWMLGWAGNSDTALIDALSKQGVPLGDMIYAGIVKYSSKEGRHKDLFKERLIFPFFSNGQVAYMAGRRIRTGKGGKYVNLITSGGESVVSKRLFNESNCYDRYESTRNHLLVTEGITDCITAENAGFRSVATCGTSVGMDGVYTIVRLGKVFKKITICFDTDKDGNGLHGAKTLAGMLFDEGINASIATLPLPQGQEKIDINLLARDEKGIEELHNVVDNAVPYIGFLASSIPRDISGSDLTGEIREITKKIHGRPTAELKGLIDMAVGGLQGIDAIDGRVEPIDLINEELDRLEREKELEAVNVVPDQDGLGYQARVSRGRKEAWEQVSTFVIRAASRVLMDDNETFLVDLVRGDSTIRRGLALEPSAWHTARNFKSAISTPEAAWFGQDGHVQQVMYLVSQQDAVKVAGTRGIGLATNLDGKHRWVTTESVIGEDGQECNDVVYLPRLKEFASRVRYRTGIEDEKELKKIARKVLPDLLSLNIPEVILPITGFFFAVGLKPVIIKVVGGFPFLVNHGGHGAGKTTTIQSVFWPLFGVEDCRTYISVTQTQFARLALLTETTSVPVVLDEYRPGSMNERQLNQLHDVLRAVYNNTGIERGTRSQSVNSYRLTAPVVLSGEARPVDPALEERMIPVRMNKNVITAKSGKKKTPYARALERLEKMPLRSLATPYVKFVLGQVWNVEAGLTDADKTVGRILGSIKRKVQHPRTRKNLAVMVYGVRLYQEFCEYMGVSIPDVETDLRRSVKYVLDDLYEEGEGPKDQLDRFLESLAAMAQTDSADVDVPHTTLPRSCFQVQGMWLHLHLKSAYAAYARELRKQGAQDETHGVSALKRCAKENMQRGGYVIENSFPAWLADRTQKVVRIDLRRAAHLDIGGFVKKGSAQADEIGGTGGAKTKSDFTSTDNVVPMKRKK